MPKRKKYIIIIISVIAAAGLLAAAIIIAWYKGAFLPGWIMWRTYRDAAWTENDLSVSLENRKVAVHVNSGELLWNSPEGVQVQDILICDMDHDGEDELMLLCWKIGKYGKVVPRFEKEEHKWFQHIYIYEFRDGGVHAQWMASELGMDVTEWSFSDSERLTIRETSGRRSRWDWYDFGLEFAGQLP